MSLDLQGRTALVTGGGTGFGFEISRRLARQGANLLISYAKSQAEAEASAAQLQALGVRCTAVRANLASVAETERLVETTIATYGRLDVVVNSAGTTAFIAFEDLAAVTEQVWDTIFDVNLKGAFFLARAAGTWMRDHADGRGVIVTIASTAAFVPRGSSLPYSISKAAVVQLTQTLAAALAPRVRVNAVAPGTAMTRWWSGRPADELERQLAGTRFKRWVEASDVGDATLELITNESISGQTLVVDLANVMH